MSEAERRYEAALAHVRTPKDQSQYHKAAMDFFDAQKALRRESGWKPTPQECWPYTTTRWRSARAGGE